MANEFEKTRVHTLLADGRISAEDHRSLISALDAGAPRARISFAFLVRPFEKLSSSAGIVLGAIAMLILSWIGAQIALQFLGALDIKVLLASESTFTWPVLLAQNAIDVGIMSIVFYVASLIARQKNLRFVDFLSSVMVSRVPYACFAIFLFALNPLIPGLLPREIGVQSGAAVLVLAISGLSIVAWFFTLCFSALRQASGLRGQALWIAYIASLVVVEVISQITNRSLFH